MPWDHLVRYHAGSGCGGGDIFQVYHPWSPRPLPYTPSTGIIGVLGIVAGRDGQQPTLALVMAAARPSLTNYMPASTWEEANQRLTEVNTIETIGEGFSPGTAPAGLLTLNAQAARMLHLHPSTTLGRSLAEALTLPQFYRRRLLTARRWMKLGEF